MPEHSTRVVCKGLKAIAAKFKALVERRVVQQRRDGSLVRDLQQLDRRYAELEREARRARAAVVNPDDLRR